MEFFLHLFEANMLHEKHEGNLHQTKLHKLNFTLYVMNAGKKTVEAPVASGSRLLHHHLSSTFIVWDMRELEDSPITFAPYRGRRDASRSGLVTLDDSSSPKITCSLSVSCKQVDGVQNV